MLQPNLKVPLDHDVLIPINYIHEVVFDELSDSLASVAIDHQVHVEWSFVHFIRRGLLLQFFIHLVDVLRNWAYRDRLDYYFEEVLALGCCRKED